METAGGANAKGNYKNAPGNTLCFCICVVVVYYKKRQK